MRILQDNSSPSSSPVHECEMLRMQDLSQMAYCNLFIAGFYVQCHEDVRLKCCFDSKIVFLCTCCFDSKIMRISQQYIWAKLYSCVLHLKRLQPIDDVAVELFSLF
ncbi:hypothetical protein VPH35_032364 [Triticum aestivum]